MQAMDEGGSVCIFCRSGAHRAPFLTALFLLWSTGKTPAEVYEHLTRMRPIVERIFVAQMDILAPGLQAEPVLHLPRTVTASKFRMFWMVRKGGPAEQEPRPDVFVSGVRAWSFPWKKMFVAPLSHPSLVW